MTLLTILILLLLLRLKDSKAKRNKAECLPLTDCPSEGSVKSAPQEAFRAAPNKPTGEEAFPPKIFEALKREKVLLITGKAGTGKTTLIKRILQDKNIRQVVVAPTGIAALQAGGRTVHSFFKFRPRCSLENALKWLKKGDAEIMKKSKGLSLMKFQC